MEPLNVVEYISSRFVLSAVAPVVNSLPLEHSEEPLTGSVIATVANRTHAAYQAAERVVLQLIPDQRAQAPERFAHVRGFGA